MVKKELPTCSQLCKGTQQLRTTVAAGEQFNKINFIGNAHRLLALYVLKKKKTNQRKERGKKSVAH